MMIALGDGRPAHLTRVHQALAGLPEGEQRRLGVLADWKNGPHLLTYRQAEYTFGLTARALGKDEPDGQPSPELQRICDDLLESSVPAEFKKASASLAVDWSDLASFSRPPPRGTSDCADPEASWGHRRNNLLHDQDELFFGYYLSDAVTVPDEHGPPVPEFARRMTVSSCRHDPVPAFTPVLTALPGHGIPLGDVLADSGYSHRIPQNWASPLRAAGAHSSRTCTPTTAAPGAPTRAPSSPTAASTARAPRGPCWNSGRSPAPPPPRRPPPTTRRPPRPPATNSAASPATTTDGYHRVAVPRRHGQDPLPAAPAVDEPGPRPPGNPHPAPGPAGLLHPADDHRPARRPRQDRAETRLPVRAPGAAPTPAAAAPSAASPPPKTPPPTTSAAAGAASWA